MRIVIQRVRHASVTVDNQAVSAIGQGLLVLVGVENGDTPADAEWLAAKTVALRIFDDTDGVMNRSVLDIGGEVLAVSQFTLTASTRKGNRPSYIRAARGEEANTLYETYCQLVADRIGRPVGRGIFGADMQVSLLNDGPVTIIIDSRLREEPPSVSTAGVSCNFVCRVPPYSVFAVGMAQNRGDVAADKQRLRMCAFAGF